MMEQSCLPTLRVMHRQSIPFREFLHTIETANCHDTKPNCQQFSLLGIQLSSLGLWLECIVRTLNLFNFYFSGQ